jgi:hypothetical protein
MSHKEVGSQIHLEGQRAKVHLMMSPWLPQESQDLLAKEQFLLFAIGSAFALPRLHFE